MFADHFRRGLDSFRRIQRRINGEKFFTKRQQTQWSGGLFIESQVRHADQIWRDEFFSNWWDEFLFFYRFSMETGVEMHWSSCWRTGAISWRVRRPNRDWYRFHRSVPIEPKSTPEIRCDKRFSLFDHLPRSSRLFSSPMWNYWWVKSSTLTDAWRC